MGRAALDAIKAVKRTRLGHVLLELGPKVSAAEVAAQLNKLTAGKVVAAPLQDRTALEIRDVNPIVDPPGLLRDLAAALRVEESRLWVRTLRITPSGTQTAVVDVPTTLLPRGSDSVRFRTGLTVVRTRALAKTVRCFACHRLGHLASACTTVQKGGEVCK